MRTTNLTRVILTLWFTLLLSSAFPQEGVVYPACWLRADSIHMGDEV